MGTSSRFTKSGQEPHNAYTIILRGHNLRPLYGSLLLEEVVEIPRSEPNAAQPGDSYVTDIQILPNEDTVPSADSPPHSSSRALDRNGF
jgi:hypothetical protein